MTTGSRQRTDQGPACEPEDARAELRRILDCPKFDASERNRRFLEYIVNETLDGQGDRIKAYSIATSVFGRGDSFDPQQDAIVRIEAGRLRRAVDHYYLTDGRDDPVRISIPVGTYVPVFNRRDEPAAQMHQEAEPKERDHPVQNVPVHRPLICVSGFDTDCDTKESTALARVFTRHIMVGLSRFTDLSVIGHEALRGQGAIPDITKLREDYGVDFVLTGAVALAAGNLCVDALVIDARNGQYIWSDCIECPLGQTDGANALKEAAERIVRPLGQQAGVIFSYRGRENSGSDPEDADPFASVLRFQRYAQTFDQNEYEPVRKGLERAIITDPGYAEAFACLSVLYSSGIRFGYAGVITNLTPARRAVALAQQAVRLSPGSNRGYLALAVAYWFNGQVDSAFEVLETSRSLNPNDMEVIGELGLRHAMRCNWDKGVALIREAYHNSPALSGTYRIGLSLWHFAEGRFEDALSEAWKIGMPGVIYPAIMIAVSAAKLGRRQEADTALRTVLALKPGYADLVVRDLEYRNLHPDLVDLLVRSLHEAGLPCAGALEKFRRARVSGGTPQIRAGLGGTAQ